MSEMGRHNLLNGHRGEDGATATAFPVVAPVLQVRQLGPVSPWPPAAPIAVPDPPAPLAAHHGVDGDKIRRASMWILAAGVAAIAAIVSYSHIYDLGRAHGGSGVAARLLPLSVDMLILVGELMLLHEADAKGRRFILGWVLVWSGILATLAANVTYGAAYGIAGAVIWGWPAYSFILAAGGMVAVVKRGAVREDDRGAADIEPPAAMDRAADKAPDKAPDTPAPKDIDKPQVARTAKRVTGLDKAADIIRRNPALSNADVAKRAGVSEKTVTRARGTVVPIGDRKTS
jgi:hypothetical protein